MATYTVCLLTTSAAHLLFGFGNLFKIPPYNPSAFLVEGNPGTGDSPLEKLLEAVFAGWYLSSILGVLLAYFLAESKTMRFTLICPLLYHIMSTYMACIHLDSWGVCNPKVQSHRMIASFHAVMTLMFGYLVKHT